MEHRDTESQSFFRHIFLKSQSYSPFFSCGEAADSVASLVIFPTENYRTLCLCVSVRLPCHISDRELQNFVSLCLCASVFDIKYSLPSLNDSSASLRLCVRLFSQTNFVFAIKNVLLSCRSRKYSYLCTRFIESI